MDSGKNNGTFLNGKTSPHQQQQSVPPIKRFLNHVSQLSKVSVLSQDDDDVLDGFSAEFDALKAQSDAWKEGGSIPAKAGALPFNIKRNRYRDIVPFDHARVVLAPSGSSSDDVDGADYINASFIKLPHDAASILTHAAGAEDGALSPVNGANGKSRLERFHRVTADSNSRCDRYIAAQGPLPKTVDDFWLMVWQQNIKVIIMACRTVEYARQKCEQYWPPDSPPSASSSPEETSSKTFDKIRIHLDSKETRRPSSEYVVRTLRIEHLDSPPGQPSRNIKQFHYTNWYDHDIPDDASAQTEIINFLRLVREEQPSPSSSSSSLSSSSLSSSSSSLSHPLPPPILIHCSAGCGRTGTLIAIDYVWSLLKRGGINGALDLFKIVRFMRFQRSAMVQTKEQYRLVYSTIATLFRSFLAQVERSNVLVEISDTSITEEEDDENHQYENWKPTGQQQQQQASSGHSYENIIPTLLMNHHAAAAAAAAAAEGQKQRKLNNNGRLDDNEWRRQQQQQFPQMLRSNATRQQNQPPHHQQQQPPSLPSGDSSSKSTSHYENIIETLSPRQQQQQQQQQQQTGTNQEARRCDTTTFSTNNDSRTVLPSLDIHSFDSSSKTNGLQAGFTTTTTSPGNNGGGGGEGGMSPTMESIYANSSVIREACSAASSPSPTIIPSDVLSSSSSAMMVSSSQASPSMMSMSRTVSRTTALSNLLSAEDLDANLAGLRRSPPLNFSSLGTSITPSDDRRGGGGGEGGGGVGLGTFDVTPKPAAAAAAVPSTNIPATPINHQSSNDLSSSLAMMMTMATTIPTTIMTTKPTPDLHEQERKALSQSSAEILSGLDELDALINAEMESVRHMQLTLAKDPATEALHKRIEDSRQIVGAYQQQSDSLYSGSSSGGAGGFIRGRSSSLSRSRSGGGGVFGGSASAYILDGGLSSMSGGGGGGGAAMTSGVSLRNSTTSSSDVAGRSGVAGSSGSVVGGVNASSKTLPTSDRSQRLTSLRKRYSGGDATDLAVNAAAATNFPLFLGGDGGENSNIESSAGGVSRSGVSGGHGVGGHGSGGHGSGGHGSGGHGGGNNPMLAKNPALLPPGWQTMTNWRNQMTPLTISTTTNISTMNPTNIPTMNPTNIKNASTTMSTPPPPLPAKQAGTTASPFMSNFVKGGGGGSSGGNGGGGGSSGGGCSGTYSRHQFQ